MRDAEQFDPTGRTGGACEFAAEPAPVLGRRSPGDELDDGAVVVTCPDLFEGEVPRRVMIDTIDLQHGHHRPRSVVLPIIFSEDDAPASTQRLDHLALVADGDVAVYGTGLPPDQSGERADALIGEEDQWTHPFGG